MNALAEIIREVISGQGPIAFSRFMDLALYHPEHGYYRRTRDPFGKTGDFYTAEQLQPTFGILIARIVNRLYAEMGAPDDFTIVELGAGRAELAEAFAPHTYIPVDLGRGAMPDSFRGIVFSNEFFDALPVDVAAIRNSGYKQMLVGWLDGRFTWVEGGAVDRETSDYLDRFTALQEEGSFVEVNRHALRWIERISSRLESGFVLTIDYGYTVRESIRFPQGTLMSYRRHAASEDVLLEPGERDITAHVCFSALEQHGAACGLEVVRFETLAQALLTAGEADQFASVLQAATEQERLRRALQLKALLFGMGETFRVMLQKKAGQK